MSNSLHKVIHAAEQVILGKPHQIRLALTCLLTGRGEDFREHAMAEQAKLPPDPVSDFYQGGAFCGMEFSGDKSKIVDWK